jgi:hypothetical protein
MAANSGALPAIGRAPRLGQRAAMAADTLVGRRECVAGKAEARTLTRMPFGRSGGGTAVFIIRAAC